MKVVVDVDLCEGYATCVAVAPDVFALDEWGYAFVQGAGEGAQEVAADQADPVRRSAIECPMNAIRYEE